jgi:methionyl-tRNA formyltransferase
VTAASYFQVEDTPLLLAGEGHGALAALRGLSRVFGDIALFTGDRELRRAAPSAPVRASIDKAPERLIVLAGYREILPAALVEERCIINVHYALLPRYRGLHSVVWALLNDEPEIGLSVHRVDAGIDSGDIIHQYGIAIDDTFTSRDVMAALDHHIAERLGEVIAGFLSGARQPQSQDASQATWVPRRNQDDCLIDFSETHRQLDLFFRALVAPYPLPQIRAREGRFEVSDHRLIERDYRTHLGRVVNLDDGAWIKTRDGFLVARTLRAIDGTERPAQEVLRLGERLA